MKILLTGGAGFIGSHLSEILLQEGHKVVIVDNFNDYYLPRIKEENLSGIRDNPDLEIVKADIRDRQRMEGLFSDHGFDAVIHLAARAGVRPSLADPRLYQDVNIGGTLTLLDAARKFSLRRFIFASSSSVYGDCPRLPLRESEPFLRPVSPYGATKLMGEHLCRVFNRQYGLSVAALRFFTVYGPRQRPDMAIHLFSRLISEGKEISVFGDGSSRRDYTFIDDITSGIYSALTADLNFEIFNLGGGHTITLSELINLLGKKLGPRPILKRMPFQPGDVISTLADVTRAGEILGYRPETELAAGIDKFITWFLSRN
ncbi:MAG: GDP-mannose 4,6-dehydratase [Candidatus Auribacterota bacterium]|nr:GDP-mannose 4,6-dehydratase [Candidatus Auribacterota bacterium]